MPTIADQFLATEQAASALLDELESLRAETQQYGAASTALDAAGRSLSSLTSEMTDLAARVRDLVLASREIGAERLLGGLDEVTTRCREHADKLQGLDQLARRSAERASAASAAIESLAARFQQGQAAADRKAEEAQGLLSEISSTLLTHDGELNAARTVLTGLQGQSDAIAASVGRLGTKLDAFAATTESRLETLEAANARLLRSVRLAIWIALAACSSGLAILLLLLTGRR